MAKELFSLSVSLDKNTIAAIRAKIDTGVITAIIYAAGLTLQKELQIPPPKQAGAFSRLATPKQKRAYWAKVRARQIEHTANGYKRRGDVVRKWVVVPIGFGRVKLSNDHDAAPFVYGKVDQQPFHAASGWPRVDTVLNDKRLQAKLQATVDKTVANLLSRI
jgi:hypothetical protein